MDAAALFLGFLAGIAAVLVFALVLGLRRAEAERAERAKETRIKRLAAEMIDERLAAKPSARIIPLRKTPDDGDVA